MCIRTGDGPRRRPYPGEAKTDRRRDAFLVADTGRTRRRRVHWLDAGDDELLAPLRVLKLLC